MNDFVIAMCLTWAVWSALHLTLVVLGAAMTHACGSARVVGFWHPRVVVPWVVRARLDAAELAAVVLHEQGHIVHAHLFRNTVRFVLLPFLPRTNGRAARQELEADAYAVHCGRAAALARALRKLSADPFDLLRARLLEITAVRDIEIAALRSQFLQEAAQLPLSIFVQGERDARNLGGRDDRAVPSERGD